MLNLKDACKNFENVQALKNVNLTIEKGKVYGLIGRNGAGKTTLLKTISKMLDLSSGTLEIDDYTTAFSRSHNPAFDAYYIDEIFKAARLVYPNYNKAYEKELLDNFEINTKKMYLKSSMGTKNIVNLVIALSANPELLLLDEPYTGLDPINREVLYKFLVDNYFDGKHTVIISSHMITEIEGYFENAIIIDSGEIVLDEPLEEVHKKSMIITGSIDLKNELEKKVNVLSVNNIGARYDLYIYDDRAKIEADYKDLTINQMDLQTLMIKMFEKKRGTHEQDY